MPNAVPLLTRTVLALLPAAALSAQAVIPVGGTGGFPDIGSAVAVASPGDVLLVAGGTYPTFRLDKGLVVMAAPNATVEIAHNLASSTGLTEFVVPAGQSATVSGLYFRNELPFTFRADVAVTFGRVTFESCLFEAHTSTPQPALRVADGVVALNYCVLLGSGGPTNTIGEGTAALRVEQAHVTAVHTWFRGGDLQATVNHPGGDGVTVVDSFFHATNCAMEAGNNSPSNPSQPAGHGVAVHGSSAVWLADCTLIGGEGHNGTAGDGLHNESLEPVRVARLQAAGGVGNVIGNALFGARRTEELVGLDRRVAPPALGGALTVDYLAAPSTPILFGMSIDLQAQALPGIDELLWLGAPILVGVATTDSAGVGRMSVPVPNVPLLRHQPLWAQAFAGASALHGSPAIGTVIR